MKLCILLFASLASAQSLVDMSQIRGVSLNAAGTQLTILQASRLKAQAKPNCQIGDQLLFSAFPERGYGHFVTCQTDCSNGSPGPCFYSVVFDDTTWWWNLPAPH